MFEIARKYQDYDITIFYKTGSQEQVNRLKKYVRVIKYKGDKIKCKRAFFNYETDIINNVEAEEYIQVVHALFKTQNLKPRICKKITRYIAVSKSAADEWYELTKNKCEVYRNPLTITDEERKEPLILISATRLTAEKRWKQNVKAMSIVG